MIKKKIVLFLFLLILIPISAIFSENETITITTYYPSPYGSYNELKTYGNTTLAITYGNVGIGTASPSEKMVIAGGNLYLSINGTQTNNEGYPQANNTILTQRISTATGGSGSADDYPLIIESHDAIQFKTVPKFVSPYPLTTTRMHITGTGNVGIGTTSPSYTLTVAGTTWSTTGWSSSDIRWKKDIREITNPLEKIMRLRGVEYKWRSDEFKENNFPQDKQIGIIAQEMEKEFPELVTTDNKGYKGIAYDKFVAVLLEAIKEQQEQIQALRKEVLKNK